MKATTKRIIFMILIIINCSIIFYFSHQIADDSSKQSSKVVQLICNIIPALKSIEGILTIIVRKTAHFSIYAMLGILTTNLMMTIENKKIYVKVVYSLGFCFFYAITDEFHQTFIPGRSGEIRDVLIDSLGALAGILLTIGINKMLSKLKDKRKEMLENKN